MADGGWETGTLMTTVSILSLCRKSDPFERTIEVRQEVLGVFDSD